eukprot:gene7599-10348_t
MSASDAIARAREIAARLNGAIGGNAGSDLGKRKNRWDEDSSANDTAAPGLGSIKKKKVYIPVKEHPEINYLGLLIGPRGATQKQLQEMSGAKIIIRGKGASKDGGPSQTGHPDDNDEMHLSIEGSEQAVEKAWKELEQILFNPEQANRLKLEQLKNLAEMQGGTSTSISSIYGDGGSDSFQIELRVPNNMVGLIIGKGGENILRIQQQLGVNAQIAKENEMLPGETFRRIVLKGIEANVNEAKKRIDDIIQTRVNIAGGSSSTTAARGGNGRDLDNPFVVRLPVPNDKVGIIIGKGGMTVKGIQERCRATIQIPVGPDEGNPDIRTISIGADSKEAVDAAQMEIFLALQSQQQQAQQAYNANANSIYMVVPDDKVGIIIGKGGLTVKDIQNRLGVKVLIPTAADVNTYPPVRTISISGPPDSQMTAKFEIERVISGNHNNNGSNNSGYPGMSNSQYGASSGQWGMPTQSMPSSYDMGGYYGAPSMYMGQTGYPQQMLSAVPQQQPYAGYYDAMMDPNQYNAAASAYALQTQAAAAPAAASAEPVPTDPTAYYNDFWLYASYYGEAAARLYYQAWSPPEGTQPPPGIVLPSADTTVSAQLTTANENDASNTTASATTIADSKEEAKQESEKKEEEIVDPEAAAAAWDAYVKQYKEWYEAHGKAAGADPNPPGMQ